MLLLPKKFGPITLMRKLGSDGVTESFVGILDEPAGKQVVVHMVLPSVRNDTARMTQLEQRAQDLAGVRHPSLVSVLDPVTVGEDRFFLEESNDGLDLERILQHCRDNKRTIPANVYLNLATQICNGLEALHGRPGKGTGSDHVLHLALQPGGLFVQPDGKLVVGGYGLQRSPTSVPAGVATLVKVDYLSPEQTHPDQKLTPASDIFSLGAVLYEMLTLEPLFRAESNLQTVHRIRRAEVAAQLSRVKEIMPGLDKVLYRALSLNARHRYQRAFVLREDLRGLMSGYSFARIGEESREFLAPIVDSRGKKPTLSAAPIEPGRTVGPTLEPQSLSPRPMPIDVGRPPERLPPALASNDDQTDPQAERDNTMSLLRKASGASTSDTLVPTGEDEKQKVAWLDRPADPPPSAEPRSRLTESHTTWIPKKDAADRAAALADSETSWEAKPSRQDPPSEPDLETSESSAPVHRTASAPPADNRRGGTTPVPPPLRPSEERQQEWPAPPKTGVLTKEMGEFDDDVATGVKEPAAPAKKSLRDATPPPVPRSAQVQEIDEDDDEPEPSRMPLILGGAALATALVAAVFVLAAIGVGGGVLFTRRTGAPADEGSSLSDAGVTAPATPAVAKVDPASPAANPASPATSASAAPAPTSTDTKPVASPDTKPTEAPVVAKVEPAPPKPDPVVAKPEPKPAPVVEKPKPEPKPAPVAEKPKPEPRPKAEPVAVVRPEPKPSTAKRLPPEVAPPKVAPIADLVGPSVPTDIAALSTRAHDGGLTGDERSTLEAVAATDANYSRSRILLYEDAKARSDRGAARKYLDTLMAMPENQYNPTLLVEQATLAFEKRDYKTAIDKAGRAEQNWARLPSDLVFSRKAMMYELEAASWQGQFYDSGGEDLAALENAIRGWEKYQRHVNTKARADLASKADAEIKKLTDMQRRLE